jgi:hypothetical protein
MIGRSTASIADLGLVDAPVRIRVVLDVTFDGVHAFELFQFLGRHMSHSGSLRSTDQRISSEIRVSWLLLLWVL